MTEGVSELVKSLRWLTGDDSGKFSEGDKATLLRAGDTITTLTASLEQAERERDEARDNAWPFGKRPNPVKGMSTTGINIFGDEKSINAVSYALHRSSQHDELCTQIRHWRDECGKVHGKLTAAEAELTRLRELVAQAFMDGLDYATNVEVSDKEEAWNTSRIKAALEGRRALVDGGEG